MPPGDLDDIEDVLLSRPTFPTLGSDLRHQRFKQTRIDALSRAMPAPVKTISG
jgi:hypothetical protein